MYAQKPSLEHAYKFKKVPKISLKNLRVPSTAGKKLLMDINPSRKLTKVIQNITITKSAALQMPLKIIFPSLEHVLAKVEALFLQMTQGTIHALMEVFMLKKSF